MIFFKEKVNKTLKVAVVRWRLHRRRNYLFFFKPDNFFLESLKTKKKITRPRKCSTLRLSFSTLYFIFMHELYLG